MKQIFIALLFLLASPLLKAQQVEGVSIKDLCIERDGNSMAVDMTVDLSTLKVGRNRAVLLTPQFVNGGEVQQLPSIGIYGRDRYYHYVRNGESMLTGPDEMVYRASRKPEVVDYHAVVPCADWMDEADLVLHRADYGCCSSILAEQTGKIGKYEAVKPFVATMAYVRPQAVDEKRDSICEIAFVDFPVSQTAIRPEYRRNQTELGKINNSIDSVKNDRDITITSITLKGYASPEGSYALNSDLAKGRTEALKKHIRQLHRFADGIIVSEFEPEDWAGLRNYVLVSNLPHRSEILELIDGGLAPDPKEWKLKNSYPEDYKFLLRNCYPTLRHTDYRIAYSIRRFTDVEEIKRVLKTGPQKLSLNEFYLAAQTYEPGSAEFNEVFETAVRMYPDDANANLNAAFTALRKKDLSNAEHYLEKSGTSDEAQYARGVYALMTGDFATAKRLFKEVSHLQQAQEALNEEARWTKATDKE